MAAIEAYYTPLGNDSGLRAYYRLNSGAFLNDSTSNAYNLTNENIVTEVTGKFGDGASTGTANTNKRLSVASNLGITGNTLSIVGWVKLNDEITSGTWTFFLHGNTTTAVDYFLYYEYNGGTIRASAARYREGTGLDVQSITNGALGTTNWHHLALTCDGTTLKFYLDGVAATGATIGANGSGGGNMFWMGGSGLGWGDFTMDDVAVYNRVLTATEISNLYSGTWSTLHFFTNSTNQFNTIRGYDASSFATAVSNASGDIFPGDYLGAEQSAGYEVYRAFWNVDTSILGSLGYPINITSATMHIRTTGGTLNNAQTVNMYTNSSASNTSLALSDYSLVGSTALSSAVSLSTTNPTDMTFALNDLTKVNQSGYTKLVNRSSLDTTVTSPTARNFIGYDSTDITNNYLEVAFSPAASGSTFSLLGVG